MNDVDGPLHREEPRPNALWRCHPHGRPLARIRRNLIVDDQDEVGTHGFVPQLNVLPVNETVVDACEKNLGLSPRRPILFETRKSKTSRLQY